MELVEGPTLADRIAQGPIPPEEALGIAMQIADGPEAAHAQDTVHRDLKPANIKLRPDGMAKVLDFGIAKALEARAGIGISGPQTPSLTTPAMTQAGILLGTAAYMSPEQARGKAVDQRADIWAFGSVLYEMLTGQFAFGGEDVPMTLARVLDRDTDLSRIPGTVSPAVRHTIKLCLEKDLKRRIADIRDVRLALEGEFWLAPEVSAESAPAAKSVWRRGVPLAAATAVVTAAIAAIVGWSLWPKPAPPTAPGPVVRFSMPLPAGQTFTGPAASMIALSPDGTRIAYVANNQLYLRNLDEREGRPVPGTLKPLRRV